MKLPPNPTDPVWKLAAFLRLHYPPARSWLKEILVLWLRWHLGEGDVAAVWDGRRIVGVAIVRPVMGAQEAVDDDYARDVEGSVLFVDVIATAHPSALPALWLAMEGRFGRRPFMAGFRARRVRRWSLERYRRLVLGAARRALLMSS